MKAPVLSLPFAADDAASAPDLRLGLEAEPDVLGAAAAYPADLEQMLTRAKSGMSAFSYLVERCRAAQIRADGVLTVRLSVRVWPSRPDLRYELILPDEVRPGEIEPLRTARTRKFWTAGGRVLELPWRLEAGRAEWMEPGCVDGAGDAVRPEPRLRVEQGRVFIDHEDARGVIAVSGEAQGYRHRFSLAFAKFDVVGDRIESAYELDAVPVTARWVGADGEPRETALDVPVPACTRALLATCSDGRLRIRVRVRAARRQVMEIAYSACSGKVLGRRLVGGEADA